MSPKEARSAMTAQRDMPARPTQLKAAKTHWSYWLSCYFLLAAMQAFGFIDVLLYGSWYGKGGTKFTAFLNILLILSSLVLFAYGYKRTRTIGTGGVIALATVGYLFLSALWSIDPATTIRVATVYLYVVLGSIGVASILTPDEYMEALSLGCFLSAVGSIGLLVVAHGTAMSEGGDYSGIFPHKNFLGQAMATGALATLHGLRVGRHHRGRDILCLLLFVGMAFASKSATSWLTIFVICAVDVIVSLWRRGGAARTIGLALAAIALPSLLFAAVDPDAILEMIGKDPTLTGRTELWALVIDNIRQKPILGWGYYAFWSPFNLIAVQISEALGWNVPQAHNGLLEMLLSIGLVGTCFFLFFLFRNILLAFKCIRTGSQALGMSTILSCTGILLVGISETVLLTPTQPSTSLFFITGLMCERTLRAARPQQWRRASNHQLRGLQASQA